MSNGDLKAQVHELNAQLSRIEHENNELRAEIGVAVGAVAAAESTLIATNNTIRTTLENANTSLRQSHERVIQAYEIQQQMDATYARLKNMELANKAIRRCNNTKYYEFETYRTIRKIVQGMMDNLDFSMINEQLIETAVEKEHLQTPAYWLTPLLVAIAAWKDDEKERAYRALGQALDLDPRKTAAFLLVFNLRLGREDASFKWFDELTRNPLMGAEKPMVLLFFSLLSKTIEDDVSDGARAKVSAYIKALVEECVEASETGRTKAISRISNAFRTFADDYAFSYPALTKHAETAPYLKTALALARNNANIIDFISATVRVDDAVRNEFLKAYIDDIVAEPCPDEVRVYDEIAKNEMIIQCEGDKEEALRKYEAAKLHDEAEFDIVAEMLDWVYTVEGRSEANPQMRKNMLVITKTLQQEAGDEYVEFYRSLFVPESKVSIGEFDGAVALDQVESSFGDVEAFFHAKAEGEKAEVKNLPAYIALGAGVAVIVAALFVALPLAAVGALALAAGGILLLVNRAKKKRIDLKHWQNIHNVQSVLSDMGDEFRRLSEEFHEQDVLSATLSDRLAAL